METKKIKDIMIPIEKCANFKQDSSIYYTPVTIINDKKQVKRSMYYLKSDSYSEVGKCVIE